MADQTTKTVEGNVDELLMSDGFSIVDSANTKNEAKDKKDIKNTEKANDATATNKEENAGGAENEAKTAAATTTTTAAAAETGGSGDGDGNAAVTEGGDKKQEESSESDATKTGGEKTEDDSKDDTKINGHTEKGDSLIITTEEDLDLLDKSKKIEEEKKEGDENNKDEKKDRNKRSGDVWVSNITRHVKATDLRRHFSKHGKVITAKIVTNGKSFFGYILMENAEIANKCVRTLHGTMLDGRKLSISRQRPDSKGRSANDRKAASKSSVNKNEKKPTDGSKSESESKSGDKTEKTDKSDKPEKTPEEKKDDEIKALKRSEDRLRREIDYYKREVNRLKRFLSDEQRRRRLEQSKSRTLGRELLDAENKLKDERRKFDREREIYEKNARTDRSRLEADRSMIKRELDEVKKLREYLKRKIDEDQARNMERERRPRTSSPYAYSSKRFREDDKPGSKYMDDRTRTPPSPPKLSSRKRSPVGGGPGFQMDKDRRYDMDDGFDKDVRHGGGSMVTSKPAAPAPPRNIWPSAFHQEVWRMPPGGGNSGPNSAFSSSQYQRQDYGGQGGPSKPPGGGGGGYSSNPRDFNKRDHYGGSSVRKY